MLTIIRNTLNDCRNWCEQLNNEKEIVEKILEIQQSINDMADHIKCYKTITEVLDNEIDGLKNENEKLDIIVFSSKLINKTFFVLLGLRKLWVLTKHSYDVC